MSLIRIPKTFFIDHVERDLPSPKVINETVRHYVIDANDTALAELVDDAKHYAHKDGPDQAGSLARSAKALLTAIGVSPC